MRPELDLFADTAFWIALVSKRDQYYQSAQEWLKKISGIIVTTHPVLVETANFLSKPSTRATAVLLIEDLHQRPNVIIFHPTTAHWEAAWEVFVCSHDKGWSYTDCCSFVLMREQGLRRALTADQHFRQAGFEVLL